MILLVRAALATTCYLQDPLSATIPSFVAPYLSTPVRDYHRDRNKEGIERFPNLQLLSTYAILFPPNSIVLLLIPSGAISTSASSWISDSEIQDATVPSKDRDCNPSKLLDLILLFVSSKSGSK